VRGHFTVHFKTPEDRGILKIWEGYVIIGWVNPQTKSGRGLGIPIKELPILIRRLEEIVKEKGVKEAEKR